MLVLEGAKPVSIDEEDGRRIGNAAVLYPYVRNDERPKVGILGGTLSKSGRMYLPVMSDSTEYEVWGVGA